MYKRIFSMWFGIALGACLWAQELPCGSIIDTYASASNPTISVSAYSNGLLDTGTTASCQTDPPPQGLGYPVLLEEQTSAGQDGDQFQCVELIRRFYREAKGTVTTGWRGTYGDAQDFFSHPEYFGLVALPNNGPNPPELDDIIGFVSADGSEGHVAIVKEIDDNGGAQYTIKLMEQNTEQPHQLTVQRQQDESGGGTYFTYFIPPRCSSCFQIQGWLRLPSRPPLIPTWTHLGTTGVTVPAGLDSPSAVYDPSSNRLIVFGGNSEDEPCCNNALNQVWTLSNANGLGGTPTWTLLTPSAPDGVPAPRSSLSAVYDTASNRMIIFGGGEFGPSVFHALYNDVWVLTNANGLGGTPTWVPLTPAGGPPPARAGHRAVYDSQNNRMIVYGGGNNGIEDVPTDVWVLTNANGLGGAPNWLQFSPAGPAPAEEHYATGYDPNTNRMIFLGGCCYYTNALTVLTNANGLGGALQWIPLSPTGPSQVIGDRPAYGYSPAANSLVVFSYGGPEGPSNDTWELLNANGAAGTPEWMNLIPKGDPNSPPTVGVASGYDIANQRLITLVDVPGPNGSVLLQTWVLALP